MAAAPAASALDEVPRFSLSASSAWPGAVITIGQVDPCPADDRDEQFVHLSFVDADGAVFPIAIHPAYAGPWSGPVRFTVPRRFISGLDPVTYSPGPAIGAGTVKAQCGRRGQVTQEYASEVFTVEGPTLNLRVSPKVVGLGDTVQVGSVDPCPPGRDFVTGAITNGGGGQVGFTAAVDPVTGTWTADVVIPRSVPGPMPGSPGAEFPLGRYQAFGSCGGGAPESGAAYVGQRLEVKRVATTPVPYVALGDSYSSGEGTFDYTDPSGSCHRSTRSYPYALADEYELLGTPNLAACSGAVTDDIGDPGDPHTSGQFRQLSLDTRLVTITIGGNDAHFARVMDRCVQRPGHDGYGCAQDEALRSLVAGQLSALAGTTAGTVEVGGVPRPVHALDDLYREVFDRSPEAKLVVGGYPRLFADDPAGYAEDEAAPGGRTCAVAPPLAYVSYSDAQWINERADELNRVIEDRVDALRAEGKDIAFALPTMFQGHRVCDAWPWINSLHLDGELPPNPLPESFHPDATGYEIAYAQAFEDALS
ncbi:SGNH/GDSL hydrolase family protein [Saccharothrix saharensis]|uniref:SGNH/GDSL hydrolase family protein n=1 Tax=Saccharothrix saharensis TaxID=571190 RepID=UPI00114DBBCC|nr:SGNH/GDSL hydrolase family protein [Saccharothrix saharensis]